MNKDPLLQSIDEEIIHENLWFAVNKINTLESDKTLESIKKYILKLDKDVYKMKNDIDIAMADGFATHIIGVLEELN